MSRILYPFLFAIFPILFLYSHNIEEVSPYCLLIPISIAVVGTSLLLLVLRLIIKDFDKVALITSFFWVLFFSYGRARDAIYTLLTPLKVQEALIGPITNYPLVVFWGFLFGIGILLIVKTHKDLSIATRFLSIMAVVLITIPLISIGIHEIRVTDYTSGASREKLISMGLQDLENLPDIYYIILDRYEREDTLRESFDYDNSKFTDYLIGKGFYVASKSHCNYLTTLPSLASSLNLRYLSDREVGDTLVLLGLIQNNEVSCFLKSLGYRYIHVSSNGLGDGMGKYAKVYRLMSKFRAGDFEASLLRTTILAPFTFQFLNVIQRDKILYAFDTLSSISSHKEPNFVFAHIMCPHGPYIFDQDGNSPKEGEGTYIDQLIFVNKKVKILVDELLERDNPPILILQGDTGQEPPPISILNAYYLPGQNPPLYEIITPVNSFRVIFNSYFNTNYSLLEDKVGGLK